MHHFDTRDVMREEDPGKSLDVSFSNVWDHVSSFLTMSEASLVVLGIGFFLPFVYWKENPLS